MKRWPTKLLGEVAEISAGEPAPQQPEDFAENGVPFVRMQDVGRLGKSTCLAETKDRLSPSASARLKRFPVGSILVPKSGASIRLNHRAILGIEAHVVSHLAVIVPRPLLNTRFAYYWLCGTDLSCVAHQADLPSMKISDLAKLQLPVPPLTEQERLVNLLDETDELRKLRAQADCRTADLIPALFHDMFGDGQSFRTKPLMDLVDADRGISYGVVQRGNHFPGGVPLLRISNFGTNKVDPSELVSVNPSISEKYRRTILAGGELVVSIRGTIGRVAVVPEEAKGWNVAREVAVVPLLPDVSRSFLHAYMLSTFAQNFITNEVRGIAQRGINLDDLRRLPVPLPPSVLQKEFAARVFDIRAMQAKQAVSHRRLDKLFQSMLHRAFQGEL